VSKAQNNPNLPNVAEKPQREAGFGLFRKVLVYHVVLAVIVVLLATFAPAIIEAFPIGGIGELAERGDLIVSQLVTREEAEDLEIVGSLIEATSRLDRLGYARELFMVLLGIWLLMLPVSWVQKGIHHSSAHDHSLDETTLILPGVVAAIVLVVQHSLALAFSLAGIVAGVQFRRALQDTFDALFILVAIGSGIAAGVQALEIAAILTVFFSYATLYVYYLGDGLESDYIALRKRLKRERQAAEAEAQALPKQAAEEDHSQV
jgi:hypothetical protein